MSKPCPNCDHNEASARDNLALLERYHERVRLALELRDLELTRTRELVVRLARTLRYADQILPLVYAVPVDGELLTRIRTLLINPTVRALMEDD